MKTVLEPEVARVYKNYVKQSYKRVRLASKKLNEATQEAADLLTQFWNEPGIADVAREAHRTVSEADGYAKCFATEIRSKFWSVEAAFNRFADKPSSTGEQAKAQGVLDSPA